VLPAAEQQGSGHKGVCFTAGALRKRE
jgi:hypothetical protein